MDEPLLDDITALLKRFASFHDSVLRGLALTYPYRSQQSHAEVTVSAQDYNSEEGQEWANVTFHIEDIIECVWHEGNRFSYQVISHGIHLFCHSGIWYIDFGGLTESVSQVNEIKQSPIYIAGKRISWQINNILSRKIEMRSGVFYSQQIE